MPPTPPDIRDYLSALVGQTVYTVVDRKPNTIIDVQGGSVIVATEANPLGGAVSIALVQDVIDRVFAGEEVVFDPKRRSAFVGAVLATLDEVDVLTDPRRARLSTAHRTAPDVARAGTGRRSKAGRTHFMYGWDRHWRDYEAQGLAGQPFRHAASNNFERMNTQVDDVVYVVVNRQGRMT